VTTHVTIAQPFPITLISSSITIMECSPSKFSRKGALPVVFGVHKSDNEVVNDNYVTSMPMDMIGLVNVTAQESWSVCQKLIYLQS